MIGALEPADAGTEPCVRVSVSLDPFSDRTNEFRFEEGISLRGIVDWIDLPETVEDLLLVSVAGESVDRESWPRVRPRSGFRVTVQLVPGAPLIPFIAKLIFAVILSIAVSGIARSLQGEPDAPDGVQGRLKSPSARDSGNRELPFTPFWRHYGKNRVFPPRAIPATTGVVGATRKIVELFLVGDGPLKISDVRIGETPIEEFLDDPLTDMEIREGWPTDEPHILASEEVNQENFSVEFPALHSSLGTTGPVIDDESDLPTGEFLTVKSDPVVRVTPTPTETIGLEFRLPQGLRHVSEKGVTGAYEFELGILIRDLDAAGAVLEPAPFEFAEFSSSVFVPISDGRVRVRSTGVGIPGGVFLSISFPTPRTARYAVEITRFGTEPEWRRPGGANTTGVFADIVWEVLQASTTKAEPKILLGDVATLAISVQAEAFAGFSGQLNCLTESYLHQVEEPTPGTFQISAARSLSRNPADAYLDAALRGDNPLSADEIDLGAIKAWRDFLAASSREFNLVFDYDLTRLEAYRIIAAAGRASWMMSGSILSVSVEELKPDVVQFFHPRNSRQFTARKAFGKLPHAIKVQFRNELKDFALDERVVYDDGFSFDGVDGTAIATRFDETVLPGVTNPDEVFRDARLRLAIGKLRPETYTLKTGIQNLLASRGDRIRVAHDVILVGQKWGRIRHGTVILNGSNEATQADLDETVTFEAGKNYSIRLWVNSGADFVDVLSAVVNPATSTPVEASTIQFSPPIPSATSPSGTQGQEEQFLFGESTVESSDYVILRKTYNEDLSATLEFVDYSPSIFDSDSGPIPSFESKVSSRFRGSERMTLDAPRIVSIEGGEGALRFNTDGSVTPRIAVVARFRRRLSPFPLRIQARFRSTQTDPVTRSRIRSGWTTLPPVEEDVDALFVEPVEEGVVYRVEVRAVSADPKHTGTVSRWSHPVSVKVSGASVIPRDVSDLRLEGGEFLVWSYENPPRDIAGFEVRVNQGEDRNWANALRFHQGLVASPFPVAGIGSGHRTILVKAVDRAGNESARPAALVTEIGSIVAENIVASRDEHALGFPGTILNGAVNGTSGDLEADQLSDVFWALADGATYWGSQDAAMFWRRSFWAIDELGFWGNDDTTTFWSQLYAALSYEFSADVAATDLGSRLWLEHSLAGISPAVEVAAAGAFWAGVDASTFWTLADLEEFWPARFEFVPFSGALTTDQSRYDFRLSTASGRTRGTVAALKRWLDVPDIFEAFEDVSIGATGTRLPLTQTYRSIRGVQLTLQDDAGSAVSARVRDKDSTLGPMIDVFNASGAAVTGSVDARVHGY